MWILCAYFLWFIVHKIQVMITSWLNIDTGDLTISVQLWTTSFTCARLDFLHYLCQEWCNKNARSRIGFDNGLAWNKKELKWYDNLQYKVEQYPKATVNGSSEIVGFKMVCLWRLIRYCTNATNDIALVKWIHTCNHILFKQFRNWKSLVLPKQYSLAI